MKALTSIRKVIDTVLSYACGIVFAFMVCVGTYQIVTRYFFNSPSTVSEELLTYSFTWMALLAAAYGNVPCQHWRGNAGTAKACPVHSPAKMADYRLGGAGGGTEAFPENQGADEVSVYPGDIDLDCAVPVPAFWHGNWRQQELAGAGTLPGTALGVWANPAGFVPGSLSL